MDRKGIRIRERHLAVDLLAAAVGSFIVDAVTRRSWKSTAIASVLGIALYFIDKIGIRNEEKTE